MIIMDENNQPRELKTIDQQIDFSYFWALDLKMLDYTLIPLYSIEMRESPLIFAELSNGASIELPANWNILVVDTEIDQIDVVKIASLGGRSYDIFVSGPTCVKPLTTRMRIVDYKQSGDVIMPSCNSHQMICQAIDYDKWITVSPYVSSKTAKNLESSWDLFT